jgi:hypothetical protein
LIGVAEGKPTQFSLSLFFQKEKKKKKNGF